MSDQLKNFLMPAADWIIVTLLNSLKTLAMQYVCSWDQCACRSL